MNKKNIAIIFGILSISSLVFLFLCYDKYQKVNRQKTKPQVANGEAIKREDTSVGEKCLQKSNKEGNLIEESLYYYISDNMWKEERKTLNNGVETVTHILNDGNWYYIWDDKFPGSGMKIEADRVESVFVKWDAIDAEMESAEQKVENAVMKNSIVRHNQIINETLVEQIVGEVINRPNMQHIEKLGYICSPETIDETIFLSPSDINFQIPPDILASEEME